MLRFLPIQQVTTVAGIILAEVHVAIFLAQLHITTTRQAQHRMALRRVKALPLFLPHKLVDAALLQMAAVEETITTMVVQAVLISLQAVMVVVTRVLQDVRSHFKASAARRSTAQAALKSFLAAA